VTYLSFWVENPMMKEKRCIVLTSYPTRGYFLSDWYGMVYSNENNS